MVIQKHGELVWELVLLCLELLMLCGHVQLGPGTTWCHTFCFGLYIHLLNVRNLFSLNASLSKISVVGLSSEAEIARQALSQSLSKSTCC